MRIAVTGSSKLAGSIVEAFNATSIRIEQDINYNDFDIFINCAHVGFEQCNLLYNWFSAWRYDDSKFIINVSSRAGLPNLSKGYLYGAQKAALDHLADNLTYNSDKKCKITTLCLGMLEDELPSLKYSEVSKVINYLLNQPKNIEVPRMYLQHLHNYQEIQQLKESRYK